MEEAYATSFYNKRSCRRSGKRYFQGNFPAVALFLEVNPELLDVNVHPTKTEVRFLNSRSIFSAVDKLIEANLTKHGAPAYASRLCTGG